MDFLREWLLSIVGATMITALAESLMPKGPVKEVGRFICGMMLLLVIVMPILEQFPHTAISYDMIFSEDLQTQQIEMKDYYNFQYKSIIEGEFEAYIVDKAMEMGIEIQPDVICFMGEDGVFQPHQVDLGVVSPENREKLVGFVSQDLGLDPAAITVKEAMYESMEDSDLGRDAETSRGAL